MSVEFVFVGQESVFLLDTIPWDFFWTGVEDNFRLVSEVSFGWDQLLVSSVFPNESFGHDNDVVTASEGIWEESDWLHDNL